MKWIPIVICAVLLFLGKRELGHYEISQWEMTALIILLSIASVFLLRSFFILSGGGEKGSKLKANRTLVLTHVHAFMAAFPTVPTEEDLDNRIEAYAGYHGMDAADMKKELLPMYMQAWDVVKQMKGDIDA